MLMSCALAVFSLERVFLVVGHWLFPTNAHSFRDSYWGINRELLLDLNSVM